MRGYTIKVTVKICGITSPVIGLICVLLAISRSSWFQWSTEELSVLGVRGEAALLFNGGIVLSGLLGLIFTLSLLHYFTNRSPLFYTGIGLLISGTIAFIIVGAVPRSIHVPHYTATGVFFILVPAGMFLFGLHLIKTAQKVWGVTSLTLAFLVLILHFYPCWPWQGGAIPQLLASLMWGLWLIISALKT